MAWAGGRGASRVNRLDRVDNPGLRVAHDFLAFAASPDPAHLGQQSFSISDAVELEVDHDVVRILDRSEHLITTNARPFAVRRVAVEGSLPTGEVRDGMFNPQNWHSCLLNDDG